MFPAGRLRSPTLARPLLNQESRLPDGPPDWTPYHPMGRYLHSTLKLSWTTVVSPLAVTVTWKVSCTRKLFPGPGPIMRKLLTYVIDCWPFGD